VNVAIGSKSYAFSLDSKGQFTSTSTIAPVGFGIDLVKGTFKFQALNQNIRTEMSALGLVNDAVPASNKTIVPIPITVSIDTRSITSSVGAAYHAAKNVSGVANYAFMSAGKPVSGAFMITSFTCVEGSDKTHNYMIKGQLLRPGNYKPAASGNFHVVIGKEDIPFPVGEIVNKNGTLTHMAAKTFKSGIKKFTLDLNSGTFMIQALRIQSDASAGGSGLPLAKSGTNVTKADLNLSFQFDLDPNVTLDAGRFIYIGRPNANAKSWKLR
jgi:hypothetical protein